MVGRDTELAIVETFLGIDGAGALAIVGEAGIGKTTLWRGATELARRRGALVLSTRPSAADANLTFAGISDLLGPLPPPLFEQLPAPQRLALDVALLRSPPGEHAPDPRAVAVGFLGVLRELAREQRVVLAIDDLQWLDQASRGILEFIGRRLDSTTISFLYASRSPDDMSLLVRTTPPERLYRIELGPLSLAALGRIIAAELSCTFPRPLLIRIGQECRGNPFYALEIARLVGPEVTPAAHRGALPVPTDLRTLTAARVARMAPTTREMLLLAAIEPASSAPLLDLDALAPAEEAGLVRIDELGRARFTHPLIAAAVHDLAASTQLRAAHRRVAAATMDPERRARHLALGTGHPDADIAAKLDTAASLARGRGAPSSATELAELALEFTPTDDPSGKTRRRIAASRFHFDAGGFDRARRLLVQVLEGPAVGYERAEAFQLLASLTSRTGTFSEARRLALLGIDAAAGDVRCRAAIELDTAYYAVGLGEFPAALVHARQAVELATASAHSELLAPALAVQAMVKFLSGHGLAREQLALALRLDDPAAETPLMMRPRYIEGLIQLWTGDLDGALATLATLQVEAAERGEEVAAPLFSFFVVWAHLWKGDLAQAELIADATRDSAHLLGDPAMVALSSVVSAFVHAHRGQPDLACAEAREAVALFEQMDWRSAAVWALWALGFAELTRDNPEAVDEALGSLAVLMADMGFGDPVGCIFLPDEIEALLALGQLERAGPLIDLLARQGAKFDRPWALAAAGRCRGALMAARGDHLGAAISFEEAIAEHRRADMPFELARTLLLQGEALRRHKDRGQARRAINEALKLFERIGAEPWTAKARVALDRLSSRSPPSGQLSATEYRVAELAAAGLSNKEIAARAFLSVKTVEANLTRIYRKLGVRSRTGLAGVVRRTDIFDSKR